MSKKAMISIFPCIGTNVELRIQSLCDESVPSRVGDSGQWSKHEWPHKNDPRVKARHLKYQATDEGKESIKKSKLKWHESNPIKKGASTMVGNYVRDGRLTKPNKCSECKTKPGRLHGHHDDYALPLVVRWLCPKCHNNWHKENGEGKNAN